MEKRHHNTKQRYSLVFLPVRYHRGAISAFLGSTHMMPLAVRLLTNSHRQSIYLYTHRQTHTHLHAHARTRTSQVHSTFEVRARPCCRQMALMRLDLPTFDRPENLHVMKSMRLSAERVECGAGMGGGVQNTYAISGRPSSGDCCANDADFSNVMAAWRNTCVKSHSPTLCDCACTCEGVAVCALHVYASQMCWVRQEGKCACLNNPSTSPSRWQK